MIYDPNFIPTKTTLTTWEQFQNGIPVFYPHLNNRRMLRARFDAPNFSEGKGVLSIRYADSLRGGKDLLYTNLQAENFLFSLQQMQERMSL